MKPMFLYSIALAVPASLVLAGPLGAAPQGDQPGVAGPPIAAPGTTARSAPLVLAEDDADEGPDSGKAVEGGGDQDRESGADMTARPGRP